MVIDSQLYYLSPVVSQGIKETHKSAGTNAGTDLIWHSADAGTKHAHRHKDQGTETLG